MKRTFSALVESVKRKKWKAFVATLCVMVLLVSLAAGCRSNQPMAPDGGGGDSPGVTTTTTAATTATIKDEPLATVTGDETSGATTTTTVNTSSADKIETTTQGGSASVTKATASKTTKTTKATTAKTTSGKKDYLDTSKLTGTQEDVGKVVGYNSLFKEEVTVVKVTEDVNNSGLKRIKTVFSDGTGICVVECEHCHEFPCPDGGGEACSEYDVKLDATKTCQQCGLPKGDGHNGTCRRTIDWANGGKVICHHYD